VPSRAGDNTNTIMPMNSKQIKIDALMDVSGVKFGTSGARGLVADMTDLVCYAYTAAFLQYLAKTGELMPGTCIAVGGDLRGSTDRIMRAVFRAVRDKGYDALNCGKVPSPALAHYGFTNGIPSIMVTGSHIPEDRNGIKFDKSRGEILKSDEPGIKSETVNIPDNVFDAGGNLPPDAEAPAPVSDAAALYVDRYVNFFGKGRLKGKKIGIYQHSAVGRDLLEEIYTALGAEVTLLGRSDTFIPVDTEAIRPEDIELARKWAGENSFDAVVSTDGDSDRPLVGDEAGNWLRGDVAGILCARYLGADAVVTPVSSNSAVEKCGLFKSVVRTRIGSPYVIEGMTKASAEGFSRVVGYEANGGFLTDSEIESRDGILRSLPTRDAVIVQLAILLLADEKGLTVSGLVATLPERFTRSNRLKDFPPELSNAKIAGLCEGDSGDPIENMGKQLSGVFGKISHYDTTDGLRITLANDDVIHFRPSGNAPELRCYSEADTVERAEELIDLCLKVMSSWK
jgi:phosphomannomutase